MVASSKVSEEASSSGCYVEKRDLSKIESGELSFKDFRKIFNLSRTEDIEFRLQSDSLYPTGRVVSDKELFISYNVFCKNDPINIVIARRKIFHVEFQQSIQCSGIMYVEGFNYNSKLCSHNQGRTRHRLCSVFWLADSNGDVKVALTVTIYRRGLKIVVEESVLQGEHL